MKDNYWRSLGEGAKDLYPVMKVPLAIFVALMATAWLFTAPKTGAEK